ncbi:MAG: stage IV sporulation protein FB [Crocinitomix sp.]
MFEESENIYPVKPELLAGSAGKSRNGIILFGLVLLFIAINYLSDSYIILIEVLLILALHELGHFLMMRIYKVKAQGMFIMSYFGNSTSKLRFSDSQRQQTFINLMGPLPGIILGSVIFIYALYIEPNIYIIEVGVLLLAVNVLNLVPIDPFDGGRIIGGFFFNRNDRLKMIFTLISSISMIVVGVYFGFLPLTVFGFLMGLKVRAFQKSKGLHEQLDETNVNYKKEYNDLTDKEYWSIRRIFLLNNPKLKEMIPSGYTLWDNERLLVEQVRQVLRIDMKPDLSMASKIAVLCLIVVLIVSPIVLVLSNFELIEWYFENANI